MKKCIWSGKESDKLVEVEAGIYAKSEYVKNVKTYLHRVEKSKKKFLSIIFSLTGVMVLFSVFDFNLGVKASLIGLAISLFIFPYATPLTTQFLGIQKSQVLVRIIAVALVIGSVFL